MDDTKEFSNKNSHIKIITSSLANNESDSITEPVKISFPEIIKQGIQRVENLVRFPNLEIPVFLQDVFPAFKEYLLFFEGLRQPFFRHFFRIILPQLDKFFVYLLGIELTPKKQLTVSEAFNFLRVFPKEIIRSIFDAYNEWVGLSVVAYSEVVDAFEKDDADSFKCALANVESAKLMEALWLYKQMLLIAATEKTLWPKFEREMYHLDVYEKVHPSRLQDEPTESVLYVDRWGNEDTRKRDFPHSLLGDYSFDKIKRGCFIVTNGDKEFDLIAALVYQFVHRACPSSGYYNACFNIEEDEEKFEHYDCSWQQILDEYLKSPENINLRNLTNLSYDSYALTAEDFYNYILLDSFHSHSKMIAESKADVKLGDTPIRKREKPLRLDENFIRKVDSVYEKADFNHYDKDIFYKCIISDLYRISFVYNISNKFFTDGQNKNILRLINYSPIFAKLTIGSNSLFDKIPNAHIANNNSIKKASETENPDDQKDGNRRIRKSMLISEHGLHSSDTTNKSIVEKNTKDILEALYEFMTGNLEITIDGKEMGAQYIDCPKADFLYIFSVKDKSISNEPVIKWKGDNKSDLVGFIYAYVYPKEYINGEKDLRISKYEHLFSFGGKYTKGLSENRTRANKYVDKRIEIIKECIKVGNKKTKEELQLM